MKPEKKALDAAIVAELRDPSITYTQVAVHFGVGLNRVLALSKQNNLTRPRGRRATKAKPTEEEKQAARMADSRCAIHGLPVSQTGNALGGFIAGCPRQDCNLIYLTPEPHGALTMVTVEQLDEMEKEYGIREKESRIHALQSMLRAQGR